MTSAEDVLSLNPDDVFLSNGPGDPEPCTYAADNIRMNNVLPGFIDSWPETPEIVARIPAGRFGKTGEIAKTVAFLLSDGAGYITGQNIRVDGAIVKAL